MGGAINPTTCNSPVASLFIKAAPCLATGNVLIINPSEKSPFRYLAVGPLFEEADIRPWTEGLTLARTIDGILKYCSTHYRF